MKTKSIQKKSKTPVSPFCLIICLRISVNEVPLYASGSRDNLHSAIVDWETSTRIESSTDDEMMSVDFASEDMI